MKTIVYLAYPLIPILLFCWVSCGPGQPKKPGETEVLANVPKTYIRYNAYDPKAADHLAALQKALVAMKNLPCDNPLSWYYQGAIHWAPPKNQLGTAKPYTICPTYAADGQLRTAWDDCTHGQGQHHFLIWHRMYIYHFEKIVRKLSGFADFALPYWEYTADQDTTQNRTMPPGFRDTQSSLYEVARDSMLNAGQPIDTDFADQYLNIDRLITERATYLTFNTDLENVPHNVMHGYIGGNNTVWNQIYNQETQGGLMGDPNTAGFDPIFWLHHSNIDRIWQLWNASPMGRKATLADLPPYDYIFFDENGKEVKYTLDSNFLNLVYNPDYQFAEQPVAPAAIAAVAMILPPDTLVHQMKLTQTVLSKKGIAFSIPNPVHRNANKKAMLNIDAPDGKFLELFVEVSFATSPKGHYALYVNLPSGAKAHTRSPSFVGYMTFFGAGHAHGDHHHGAKSTAGFYYELTDEFRALKALDNPTFNFSLHRLDAPDPEAITIERVLLTAK